MCISDGHDANLLEHNHFLRDETICINATSAPSNVFHRTFLGSDQLTFLGIVASFDRSVQFNRCISSTPGHNSTFISIGVVRCHTIHDDAVDKIVIRLIACYYLSRLTHYESYLDRLSTGSGEILLPLFC